MESSTVLLFGSSVLGSLLLLRRTRKRLLHGDDDGDDVKCDASDSIRVRRRGYRHRDSTNAPSPVVSIQFADPEDAGRCTLEGSGDTITRHWTLYVSENGCEDRCGLRVVNKCGRGVVLCWVHPEGKLFHYRPIPSGPVSSVSTERDADTTTGDANLIANTTTTTSTSTSGCNNVHNEFTSVMHSFVLLWELPPYPDSMDELDVQDVVCVFRPEVPGRDFCLLLEVAPPHTTSTTSRNSSIPSAIVVSCKSQEQCPEVASSVDKHYDSVDMHGFTVNYEPGVFDRHGNLQSILERDLHEASRLLPTQACELLKSTVIWLNDSLTYGPLASPIEGVGCCYHPQLGSDWLRRMGMNTNKAGCIEMYSAAGYLDDHARGLWGAGGLVLHELSHAYHDKFCAEGYNNQDILTAFEKAMCNHLYDSVNVHGSQGRNGPIRAYACTNCMEYWAELSVAYLWCEDDVTEFNKWFPYNRRQLKEHDKDAFEVLHRLWNDPKPQYTD